MPKGEELAALGASRATLAIHLSVRNIHRVVAELTPHYGADCPVVVVFRVGWPDAAVIRGTLGTIRDRVKASKITRTALIFVGRVFENDSFSESRLYHPDHRHILRPGKKSAGRKAKSGSAAAPKALPLPE
jgi:precorrin-4/cobalt-precorrin-4 C11-methyltransferase